MPFLRFDSNISVLILLAATVTVGSVTGQTTPPPESRRLEIRVIPLTPTPPQARDGDAIRTGPEGEVVVEWKDAAGKAIQGRIPRRNRVSPEIATETKFTDEGRINYSYTVANGPAARQDIVHFALGVRRPDLITNPSSPENWWRPGSSLELSRWYWGSKQRISDIQPGRSNGPFRYESPLLPGLMDAYFEGYLSTEEATVGPAEWGLSIWLAERLSEALRFENNSVHVKIVGPKIEITPTLVRSQLADAIADEMLAASRMPEFEEHRLFLEDMSSILKNTHRIAVGTRRGMLQMSGTALQRSFLQAMALNLEYLEKLP